MPKRPVTIKDIAGKLNISVSTVSRALKNNPEISLQTRETVQKLAKEMNYFPNPLAVALKTKRSNTIGVVVPQIVSSFYATVVKGIEKVADERGYQVFVSSSNERLEKEIRNVNSFINHRMDGIILSLSKATNTFDHIRQIKDMEIPMVLFDRTSKELDVSKVVADDSQAAYKAVTHLIQGGAKRIALITGPEYMLTGRNRMRICRCEFNVESARVASLKLLERINKADAVFGINDDMAIGALRAAQELNISVPEELTIVGFSNSRRSRYMKPQISTIDQNPREIGRIAAELLFNQINNDLDSKTPKEIIVSADLIIRESSENK